MMKKFLMPSLCIFLLGAVACGGKQEKRELQIQDSIVRADSISQAELAMAEKMRLDSLREDSIRREDSIHQEKEMRIDPTIFAGQNYREKLRKKYGFKVVVDRKFMNYDIDGGMEDYEYKYSRTFNGRKIVYDEWGTTCMGASLTFYSKIDKDNFIEDIKKAGYKKEEYGAYINPRNYHSIYFEGNKAYVVDCG